MQAGHCSKLNHTFLALQAWNCGKEVLWTHLDKVQAIYLFGSYARGDADESSDLDFLVFGGESFKLTMIFSLAEELRSVLKKNVDVFEISEINCDSEFYNTIMKERMFVA